MAQLMIPVMRLRATEAISSEKGPSLNISATLSSTMSASNKYS